MTDDGPIIVTNRDLYDLLNAHIKTNNAWQVEHQRRDDKIQTGLTIKFYGILGGIGGILAIVTMRLLGA